MESFLSLDRVVDFDHHYGVGRQHPLYMGGMDNVIRLFGLVVCPKAPLARVRFG
jgi:hypothetical protein